MRTFVVSVLGALTCLSMPSLCQQQTVDFEQFSGPSVFTTASAPVHVAGAMFSGGEVLRNTTFAPADQSAIYATSSFCSSCLQTITINFTFKVSGFSVFIGNGNIVTVAYTVTDDQGGEQTITLQANFDSGGGTVSLPEANITCVQISAGPAYGSSTGWDFFIDDVIFTPASPSLVDPVPVLVNSSGIGKNTDAAATKGNIVQAVAADGVSQLLIRIPAIGVGQNFTVTLYNDEGDQSTSPAQDGAVAALGKSPTLSTVNVSSVDTPAGPMAFAIYRSPKDFSRGAQDNGSAKRSVSLQIQIAGKPNTRSTTTINVLRAPVILIHGLWSNDTAWSDFLPLINDDRFFIRRVNYGGPIAVTATVPTYKDYDLSKVPQSALGFAYNAYTVGNQIQGFINDFKTANNAADVQADIVAHSMGGDIARQIAIGSSYTSASNFFKGTIHKLITIGTPHLGSPLAIQLLNGSNGCVATVLLTGGSPSFETVVLSSEVVTGGVGDLKGNGKGASLSVALATLQAFAEYYGTLRLPSALIAGYVTKDNLNGLGAPNTTSAFITSSICPKDPLAIKLTSAGWPMVLGGPSDALVPITSELNNAAATSPGMQIPGVIHSRSLSKLNFNPPAELDMQRLSMVPDQVVNLLNEVLTGPDYQPL